MIVKLTGSRTGLDRVSLIRLIIDHASYRLYDAKHCVDDLLAGQVVCIAVATDDAAMEFLERALELGAIGHLAGQEE